MTVAVCFQCGAMKFGAFTACKQCGATPLSEDDYVLSLAMTDHYFDEPTLREMGAKFADGRPQHLTPESRRNLIQMLRSSGKFHSAVRATDVSDADIHDQRKTASQADWVLVHEFGESRTYVDRASLQRSGPVVTAIVRYNLNPPATDKRNGKLINEMFIQEEYDTVGGLFRVHSLSFTYTDGSSSDPLEAEPNWCPATEGNLKTLQFLRTTWWDAAGKPSA